MYFRSKYMHETLFWKSTHNLSQKTKYTFLLISCFENYMSIKSRSIYIDSSAIKKPLHYFKRDLKSWTGILSKTICFFLECYQTEKVYYKLDLLSYFGVSTSTIIRKYCKKACASSWYSLRLGLRPGRAQGHEHGEYTKLRAHRVELRRPGLIKPALFLICAVLYNELLYSINLHRYC